MSQQDNNYIEEKIRYVKTISELNDIINKEDVKSYVEKYQDAIKLKEIYLNKINNAKSRDELDKIVKNKDIELDNLLKSKLGYKSPKIVPKEKFKEYINNRAPYIIITNIDSARMEKLNELDPTHIKHIRGVPPGVLSKKDNILEGIISDQTESKEKDDDDNKPFGGSRKKKRRNQKSKKLRRKTRSKKGKRSRKARKSRRKSNRRRGRR